MRQLLKDNLKEFRNLILYIACTIGLGCVAVQVILPDSMDKKEKNYALYNPQR